MPYKQNSSTRSITISAGDTMNITVTVNGRDYDAAVFAIFNPTTGEDVMAIPAELSDGSCVVRLAAKHTRDIPAGKQKYNIRLVSDSGRDEDGNVIADDDSDNVLSVFGPENNTIPDFILRRTGAYV